MSEAISGVQSAAPAPALSRLDRGQARPAQPADQPAALVPLDTVRTSGPRWTRRPGMDLAAFDRWGDQHLTTKAVGGNSVKTLIGGESYFNALNEAVAGAKRSILVVSHTLGSHPQVDRLIDKLVDKARSGLPVTFVIDWFGHTRNGEHPHLQRMRDAGVDVQAVDDKVFATRAFETTHSKITIVDGEVGFVGGHNLSGGGYKKHDVTLEVRGPVLQDVQSHYERIWREAGGQGELRAAPVNTSPAGTVRLRSLETRPQNHDFRNAIVHAIDSARDHINVEQAYMTDHEIVRHLQAAAKRGVRVRVVMPEVSDEALVDASHRHNMWRWAASGMEIMRYPHDMHTKALSVDGVWATIGSTNFTNRGSEINYELSLALSDPAAVQQLDRDLFATDRSISRRVTPSEAIQEQGGIKQRVMDTLKSKFIRPFI